MSEETSKSKQRISFPMLAILMFVAVPTTVFLITEIAGDKIIYRTLTQGFNDYNK